MATTRGRAIHVGGVGGPAEVQPGRVDPNNLVRPAYAISNEGRLRASGGPAGVALGLGAHSFLTDPSQIGFWRFLIGGLALAYVVGFHVTLGRTRLGLGPAR
jgi:hypothetical protein